MEPLFCPETPRNRFQKEPFVMPQWWGLQLCRSYSATSQVAPVTDVYRASVLRQALSWSAVVREGTTDGQEGLPARSMHSQGQAGYNTWDTRATMVRAWRKETNCGSAGWAVVSGVVSNGLTEKDIGVKTYGGEGESSTMWGQGVSGRGTAHTPHTCCLWLQRPQPPVPSMGSS